ncbi:MAG: ABC transporter ATP-binding protein [Muribaculaceae bacterium]|nr:ABC transporter ATP-binding protein [Muribaculaceae bacterium]MDE6643542.1 ABC transporter ATP-binding protein [Muribaculaceae bacterium]
MNSVVNIKNLSHSYGSTVALDNVSIEVERGEMFGIIGPDGAGKSTLYRILATLLKPDRGEVFVSGLNAVTDYKKIRTKIGYMPERFSLYQDMTVNENLKFYASLFGVSVKENYDLIAPVFSQLERFPNRRASALSGGMKQKLALSCALIHRPEILLLDEPTTGVDAVSRSEFWDMLSQLRKSGITILVSTSYMDEATRCERIAMINKGKILDTNTPANLVANLNENLYSASADDMFCLLNRLRTTSGVKNCYTFGATLHVVADNSFDPDKVSAQLTTDGLKNVKIYRTKGDIEDLFIKLTHDG